MSFSDTANAKKYASIAEVAAAQAKLYASKLEGAPDYAAQAAASATASAASAQAAVSAEGVVNNLSNSASESATSAAAAAAEAGNAAAAAVSQCLRVPDGESVDTLPQSTDRQNTFLTFDSTGNTQLLPESNVAILDSEGKIPVSMIPAIALSEVFVVNSQAAMLSLDAQVGDIAKRTDLGYSFTLAAEPASILSNWVQLNDDVMTQLALPSGASNIGAVDDESNATTVQALLNRKANTLTLSSDGGAAGIGAIDSSLSPSTVQGVLDQKADSSFGQTTLSASLIRSFEFFGAKGDGLTDDTAAIQAAAVWVTGGNNRYLTTEQGKVAYRVTSTINFNFANGRGHAILMKSPIRPDAGTGTAFLIQNTRDSVFDLKVDGGGDSNADYYVPESDHFIDYRQADPTGAQTAFYIRGIRNSDINVTGIRFSGRVLRTNALDISTGGIIKTSFNTLRIKTGDQGAGETVRCGQAYYLQGDDSAWGKIDRAWLNWDRFGSIHYKLVDITIGNIEAGFSGNGGLQFYGIATAHIGTLSVGDETFTNTNILFANSTDGQECIAIHIDRIFAGSGNIGVELRGSNGSAGGNRPNYDINSIYVITCTNSNVLLNGVNNSVIRDIQSQGGLVAVRLQRVIRNIHLTLNSSSESASSILADSGANINNMYVNGRSYGNTGATTVDLSAATGGMRCVFDGYTVRSGLAAYAIPVTNYVTIQNGEIDTSGGGVAFSVGVPKVNVNNVGFITRNRGGGNIAIGNQTVMISHGLAQQPTEICITPTGTAGAFKVINIGPATFDVQLPAVVSGTAWTFNWVASCEYH